MRVRVRFDSATLKQTREIPEGFRTKLVPHVRPLAACFPGRVSLAASSSATCSGSITGALRMPTNRPAPILVAVTAAIFCDWRRSAASWF